MPTLLVIESSPRGDRSLSRGLTKRFVEAWSQHRPGGRVVERDLMRSDLPFVTMPWLGAYFTPVEQHTPEMKASCACPKSSWTSFWRPTTSPSARRSTTTTCRPS